MAAPVSVLLADNHAMFLRAVVTLLQQEGGCASSARHAGARRPSISPESSSPTLVVMQVDRNLREAREEITRILAATRHAPKVVILSMHGDPDFARRTLEMGASAYVHKSGSVDDLLEAVRSAATSPAEENVVVALPQRLVDKVQAAARSGLSAREVEVVM